MKKLSLLILIIIIGSNLLKAQAPIFHKYPIAETGYAVYFPKNPGNFEVTYSKDSLLMYLGNVEFDNIGYDMILTLLNDTYANTSKEELEKLLVTNLDFLKGIYNVSDTTGYVRGQKIKTYPNVTGILDSWKDKYGSDIIIKGWVNNKVLVVLVVSGKPLPPYDFQTLFLNRFVFGKK